MLMHSSLSEEDYKWLLECLQDIYDDYVYDYMEDGELDEQALVDELYDSLYPLYASLGRDNENYGTLSELEPNPIELPKVIRLSLRRVNLEPIKGHEPKEAPTIGGFKLEPISGVSSNGSNGSNLTPLKPNPVRLPKVLPLKNNATLQGIRGVHGLHSVLKPNAIQLPKALHLRPSYPLVPLNESGLGLTLLESPEIALGKVPMIENENRKLKELDSKKQCLTPIALTPHIQLEEIPMEETPTLEKIEPKGILTPMDSNGIVLDSVEESELPSLEPVVMKKEITPFSSKPIISLEKSVISKPSIVLNKLEKTYHLDPLESSPISLPQVDYSTPQSRLQFETCEGIEKVTWNLENLSFSHVDLEDKLENPMIDYPLNLRKIDEISPLEEYPNIDLGEPVSTVNGFQETYDEFEDWVEEQESFHAYEKAKELSIPGFEDINWEEQSPCLFNKHLELADALIETQYYINESNLQKSGVTLLDLQYKVAEVIESKMFPNYKIVNIIAEAIKELMKDNYYYQIDSELALLDVLGHMEPPAKTQRPVGEPRTQEIVIGGVTYIVDDEGGLL